MKRNKSDFNISFAGLKEGEHDFQIAIGAAFFEAYDSLEVNNCDIELMLTLTKQTNMLVFQFDLNGFISLPCDRCLDNLNVSINGNQKLFVKFGKEMNEESEEVIIIPNTAHEINIEQYVYEYITLLIPQKNTHSEGQCNKSIEKKLNDLQVIETVETDPRWNALKNYNIN